MAEDLMQYDVMTRNALRGVVRQALERARTDGLPGAHHFYITFRSSAPGTDIDPQLLERYPDEMTIVLEHQFWDLQVDDEGFEVTLKFARVPKYLRVPWDALVQFHDPSVGFSLRFDPAEASKSPQGDKTGSSSPSVSKAAAQPAIEAHDEDAGPKIVSLDAFRKKTD